MQLFDFQTYWLCLKFLLAVSQLCDSYSYLPSEAEACDVLI